MKKSHDDISSHVYGLSYRTTGMAGALEDIIDMARKNMAHTHTMVTSARLSGSGMWTSTSLIILVMHALDLVATLPSLGYLIRHPWYGLTPSSGKVILFLPLNLLTMIMGQGRPSLVAGAVSGLV